MLTAQEVIYERPPEGLARGRVPAPWWLIAGTAAFIVVGCIVFLLVRWRIARIQSLPPKP